MSIIKSSHFVHIRWKNCTDYIFQKSSGPFEIWKGNVPTGSSPRDPRERGKRLSISSSFASLSLVVGLINKFIKS